METSNRRAWGAAVLIGVLYFAVGLVLAAAAGAAESNQLRTAWRFSAWVVSAVIFAIHIRYGLYRRRNAPSRTALHASAAVVLGTFLFAVMANIHANSTPTAQHHRIKLALIIWPVLTGVTSYLVAWLGAAGLIRARKSV
jgi:glucan phosphoethanolaminetransferase (alkaline phosphatase superfamily)